MTEVDLGGDGGVEIRMRANLVRRILSYACENLPTSLTIACYRFWESTSLMLLLNDRCVERVSRTRAAVPEAYLRKMDDILLLTGGSLRIPTTHGYAKPLVVDSLLITGELHLAGWQSSTDENRPSVSSSIGLTAQTPTPAMWLSALASNRPCSDSKNHGVPALQKLSNTDSSQCFQEHVESCAHIEHSCSSRFPDSV